MLRRPSPQANEMWQELVELRCQREVTERWLASCSLPDGMQHYLYAMLREINEQLDKLTSDLGVR